MSRFENALLDTFKWWDDFRQQRQRQEKYNFKGWQVLNDSFEWTPPMSWCCTGLRYILKRLFFMFPLIKVVYFSITPLWSFWENEANAQRLTYLNTARWSEKIGVIYHFIACFDAVFHKVQKHSLCLVAFPPIKILKCGISVWLNEREWEKSDCKGLWSSGKVKALTVLYRSRAEVPLQTGTRFIAAYRSFTSQ